jgi:hypothetical protein
LGKVFHNARAGDDATDFVAIIIFLRHIDNIA